MLDIYDACVNKTRGMIHPDPTLSSVGIGESAELQLVPFGKRHPHLGWHSTAGCKLPSTGVLGILRVWSLAQGYLGSSEKFGFSSPGKSTFQLFSRSGLEPDTL